MYILLNIHTLCVCLCVCVCVCVCMGVVAAVEVVRAS